MLSRATPRQAVGVLLAGAVLAAPTAGSSHEREPSATTAAKCPIDLRGLEGGAGGPKRKLRRARCARPTPLLQPDAVRAAPKFAAKQGLAFTPEPLRQRARRAARLKKHANTVRRRLEARLDRARPAARSAARGAAVQVDLGGGKTGFASGSTTKAPEGMTGEGSRMEIGIEKKDDDGVTSGFSLRTVDEAFVATCPTAAGEVKGTRTFLIGLRLAARDATASVSADFEMRLDVEYTGQVAPDARLKHYDYRSTATITGKGTGRVKGKTYGGGSQVYRGFDSARGVPIGDGKVPEEDALRDAILDAINSERLGAWGPKGKLGRDRGATGQKGIYFALGYTVIGRYFAAQDLLKQQKHWYDEEACARVEATPDRARVKRGGSASWRSTVVASNGKPAAAQQRAKSTASGRISPTSASTGPAAAATFTITDTQNAWQPNQVGPSIRIDILSRAGKAHYDGSLPVEDEIHYFAVTVEYSDSFSWSKKYSRLVSPGTESECRTNGSGSGTRSSFYATTSGEEQTVALTADGAFHTSGDGSVRGRFTQDGSYSSSSSGPNCSSSDTAPTSGCGTNEADGRASVKPAGAGRLSLYASGLDPFADLHPDCPITWPYVLNDQGEHDEGVGPFLLQPESVPIPLDQMRDTSRETVVVSESTADSAMEYCSASGSNNGGQCGPEETLEVSGSNTWTWKLTFTRITPP